MKFLLTAFMAGVLLLAGCASTTPPLSPEELRPGSSENTPIAAPGGNAVSVFPDGPLSPIKPGNVTSNDVATLTPPTDVWDRIRRGFKMPNLEGNLVREREQWYATRPDYIARMTERSNKYIFHIVEELERRNMPTELALLPYIESAFNPQAVSSARAAGMWQFMPATGTDYRLKQNIFRDDRRDVIASTRAALDYLQRLYGMFGDWNLALAAYNWGEGSVGRAIAKNQRLGLPTGYTDLSMPAETRLYVPKLQAVKNIVANPELFRAELPLIPNHPYFQSVALTRDLDVALAAKLADMPLADFRALNPAAHKPVLLAAGSPQILLPWDNAALFQRNFDGYGQGQYASWTAWTVPSTMTVADAAQRTGMSETDLRALNNVPPRMLIKTGSTLIVPRGTRVVDDVSATVADTGHMSLQPEIVLRRTTVRARRHDSVASIAGRYRVAASNVAQWNSVKTGHAFAKGFQVVVYLPVQAARAAEAQGQQEMRAERGHKRHGRAEARAGKGAGKAGKHAAGKTAVVAQKRGGEPSKKKH